MRRARTAAAAVGAIAVLFAADARAQQVAMDWAFGSPAAEAVLVAAGTASIGVWLVPQKRGRWGPSPARPHDEGWAGISDLTGGVVGTGLALGSGFALEGATLERGRIAAPYETAVRASLAELEAALWTTGAVTALKRATGRCRPRAWRVGPDGVGACHGTATDAHVAFPSGHTAPVAAVAAVRLALLARAPDDAGLRWAGFASAESLATGVAFTRVLAGAHSWEDVVVGWALGHAIGAAIGLAHPITTPPARTIGPPASPSATSTIARWQGSF